MVAANSPPFAQFPCTVGDDPYVRLFRDAGDAMLLLDEVVLECNPAALKLFRADRDQVIGRPLKELYPPQQRDGTDSSIAAHDYSMRAATGEVPRYEWTFLRPDHTRFEAWVTLSRVGNAGSGWRLAILRDSSEAPAAAVTEQFVAQRTAQLESVTAELDAFAYSISHDLRAAVQGIAACSQIVIDDYGPSLPEEAKRWLAHIRDDSKQLDSLTEGMLDLSRVSRKVLDTADLDLTAMAREIGRKLASESKGRTVEFLVCDGLRTRGDTVLVQYLLQNLLENSWKFTGKTAQGRIEFGRAQSDSPGNMVFYVRDNGAGFDMAHAERLFVAFQRLHRDPAFPGNGIGLAMVRRIVHRHGGKVWAESAPGLGATFFFTLDGRPV